MIAEVGVSISGRPGPPFGPSYLPRGWNDAATTTHRHTPNAPPQRTPRNQHAIRREHPRTPRTTTRGPRRAERNVANPRAPQNNAKKREKEAHTNTESDVAREAATAQGGGRYTSAEGARETAARQRARRRQPAMMEFFGGSLARRRRAERVRGDPAAHINIPSRRRDAPDDDDHAWVDLPVRDLSRPKPHTRTHARPTPRTHARARARAHARTHTHTHTRTHARTHARAARDTRVTSQSPPGPGGAARSHTSGCSRSGVAGERPRRRTESGERETPKKQRRGVRRHESLRMAQAGRSRLAAAVACGGEDVLLRVEEKRPSKRGTKRGRGNETRAIETERGAIARTAASMSASESKTAATPVNVSPSLPVIFATPPCGQRLPYMIWRWPVAWRRHPAGSHRITSYRRIEHSAPSGWGSRYRRRGAARVGPSTLSTWRRRWWWWWWWWSWWRRRWRRWWWW